MKAIRKLTQLYSEGFHFTTQVFFIYALASDLLEESVAMGSLVIVSVMMFAC